MATHDHIVVQGAREHNLKAVDVSIPRDKLVVITGVSGSGKSSLAFDTIYAEGQRRYVESLSTYARQFLDQMQKPEVDHIFGLSPAISIQQRTSSATPRSTVGTSTEIYDYLRVLFSRVGTCYCYECGKKIERYSVEQVVEEILDRPEDTPLMVLAPLSLKLTKDFQEQDSDVQLTYLLLEMKKKGFRRVLYQGKTHDVDAFIGKKPPREDQLFIVIDTLKISTQARSRISESVEMACSLSDGLVGLGYDNHVASPTIYSEHNACVNCGISYGDLEPRRFSFNSPYGACSHCHGLGYRLSIDPDCAIPDKSRSIQGGCIVPWERVDIPSVHFNRRMLRALAAHYGFDLDTPFRKLPAKIRKIIMYGAGKRAFKVENWRDGKLVHKECLFEGVVPNLERRFRETESFEIRRNLIPFMTELSCQDCGGMRLRRESLNVRIQDKNIIEVTQMSIDACWEFFAHMQFSGDRSQIARDIVKEISGRLTFLRDVGLGYLTLDRQSSTLSGGEAQRIRLATQIGAGLVGVIYILDEPSIGLHQKDNAQLIDTLKRLVDLGNTVIVVEHDAQMIRSSDYVIDLGPGAGEAGGRLVYAGDVKGLLADSKSLTGQYLVGKKSIPLPKKRRSIDTKKVLCLKGARAYNLKSIDVTVPLGVMCCVTGVSGSGKSTLIDVTLKRALRQKLFSSKERPGEYDTLEGHEHLDRIRVIDQSPIGKTPRSNPATYSGVFDPIRKLFTELPLSKMRGFASRRFSFNVKGGRCEVCKGDGVRRIEMHFLPDAYIRCSVCHGRRYNRETLEAKYKGKDISDVLGMTVDQAYAHFTNIPAISEKLRVLINVGLGYIRLGQSATTLSGGEAQRLKIARELAKRASARTLYMLDEPTTGLHFHDVSKLIHVLNSLVEAGNTVLVIEHNLDVIKSADYIVDLGPGGGEHGGQLIASGSPEQLVRVKESFTGQYLREVLK